MITAYACGVWDLFHRGHVEFLRRCRRLSDRVVVAVNGDLLVDDYKGRPPVVREADRLAVVESCRYVDHAFVIPGYDNRASILLHGANKIVHGDDWPRDEYLEQIRIDERFLSHHGIEFVHLPRWRETSSTEIRAALSQRIAAQW